MSFFRDDALEKYQFPPMSTIHTHLLTFHLVVKKIQSYIIINGDMGNFVKRVQKKLPHGAYDSGYSADPKQKN